MQARDHERHLPTTHSLPPPPPAPHYHAYFPDPHARVLTLSALDFDAGNMISYRIVTGNTDACFYLDETSGVLSTKCDLARLPMFK